MNKKHGFTLIELLVVIAIIAVLIAFAVANFVGARSRALDVKEKSELQQVKNALRLYYNDYQSYPGPSGSASTNSFNGCGTPPTSSCSSAPCNGQFAAGGNNGCGSTVYMKLLPSAISYVWSYEQMSGGDDFCLWATLNNQSDTDISGSQARCPVCGTVGYNKNTDYVMCAD